MQFELIRLNNKVFLAFTIAGFVAGILVSSLLADSSDEMVSIIVFIVTMVAFIFAGYQIGKKKIVLDLRSDEFLVYGEMRLDYENIIGYHKFDEAILGGAFGLLTSDLERHNVSSIFSGDKKELFYEAQEQIIAKLLLQNPNAKELTYSEYHQKQMSFIRPVLYVLVGLVITIDVVLLVWFIPSGKSIPYQFWFMNLVLLGLYFRIKRM